VQPTLESAHTFCSRFDSNWFSGALGEKRFGLKFFGVCFVHKTLVLAFWGKSQRSHLLVVMVGWRRIFKYTRLYLATGTARVGSESAPIACI